MSEWIKLRSQGGDKEVYVNMTQATCIIPMGHGSRVCFAGDDENYIDVTEDPATVTDILERSRDANRT